MGDASDDEREIYYIQLTNRYWDHPKELFLWFYELEYRQLINIGVRISENSSHHTVRSEFIIRKSYKGIVGRNLDTITNESIYFMSRWPMPRN